MAKTNKSLEEHLREAFKFGQDNGYIAGIYAAASWMIDHQLPGALDMVNELKAKKVG